MAYYNVSKLYDQVRYELHLNAVCGRIEILIIELMGVACLVFSVRARISAGDALVRFCAYLFSEFELDLRK